MRRKFDGRDARGPEHVDGMDRRQPPDPRDRGRPGVYRFNLSGSKPAPSMRSYPRSYTLRNQTPSRQTIRRWTNASPCCRPTAAWRPIRTARAGPLAAARPGLRVSRRETGEAARTSPRQPLYGVGLLSFSPDGELCVTAHEKGRPADAVSFVMLNIEREDARTLFVWTKQHVNDFVIGPPMPWDTVAGCRTGARIE